MPRKVGAEKARAEGAKKARIQYQAKLTTVAAAVDEEEHRRESVEAGEFFRHEENQEAIDGGLRSLRRSASTLLRFLSPLLLLFLIF